MTIHKLTVEWKKVLERQARPVTLLITFQDAYLGNTYVRLGEGAPKHYDADIMWRSAMSGGVISISVPPNTPVYAQISAGTAYISCTIIPSIEEE